MGDLYRIRNSLEYVWIDTAPRMELSDKDMKHYAGFCVGRDKRLELQDLLDKNEITKEGYAEQINEELNEIEQKEELYNRVLGKDYIHGWKQGLLGSDEFYKRQRMNSQKSRHDQR